MDDVHTHPPFDKWDEAVVRRLLAGRSIVPIRTGKALFYQGERADQAFLILSGSVRTVMYRSDETSLDLGTQGPGDWVGLAEMVVSGPYLTDALALGACRCLGLDRSALERLRAAAGGSEWLSSELARKVYALHARIELAQPGQRLARWLVDHATGPGPLVCTQEELASAVGTSRETVNRHLGRMQAEGLVRLERGRVTILDTEGLEVWGAE